MSEDPYKSPESNVAIATDVVAVLPNPFVVAGLMIAASIMIGAIIAAIEYLMATTLPANTFLSTIVPALIVGSYYGKKRQVFFPANFRVKVILIWLVMGLMLTGLVFSFIDLELLKDMAATTTFIAIFIGMILLGALFCYFALRFGEKLGIKSSEKKS